MRPVGYVAGAHVIQLAVADEFANSLVSVVARIPGAPVRAISHLPINIEEGVCRAAPELESLGDYMAGVCGGAAVVTFERVATAFLPRRAVLGLRHVLSVRSRYCKLFGCADDRPVEINQVLVEAGFPALRGVDAAARALAVRDLHYWLCELETVQPPARGALL